MGVRQGAVENVALSPQNTCATHMTSNALAFMNTRSAKANCGAYQA